MNNNIAGKTVKKVLGIIAFLLIACCSYATHEVGGYISLKCLGGYTYEATITTYTNTYLTTADRDTMRLFWGDGQSDVLIRQNGPIDENGFPGGVPICNYDFSQAPPQPLVDARKINIYIGTHTYTGPNQRGYILSTDDPDRMANISNILNSVQVDLYLKTILCISPFSGCVNTPVITNEPVCQYGCTGECYTYNPGAYIPTPPDDGDDSIEYVLGNSLAAGGQLAPAYYIPAGTTLDAHTGTLKWCSTESGKWNFVILMVTWSRSYIDGGAVKVLVPVDTEELELEVIINSNCNPPTVTSIDTCVVAGDTVNDTFHAQSGTTTNLIYITDAGEPFSLSPPATLSNYAPGFTVNPKFHWPTNCPEVRDNPYEVVIEATEKVVQGNGFPPDTAYYRGYGTAFIKVIGPAPDSLKATVEGTTVCLTWGVSPCNQAIGYNIYRQKGCPNFTRTPCQTGVPAAWGYTLIATNMGLNNVTYCDSNAGQGLSPGVQYSYIVDAIYPLPDGSQSIATNDTCVLIKLDVPIITNVSVTKTDPSNGEILVKWIKPITDRADLDTSAYPPPYTYILMRATGMNNVHFTPIITYTSAVFKTNSFDTNYTDVGLNTVQNSYNYKIDFYSGSKFVGTSGSASSIYLALQRGDSKMKLGWASVVPWNDDSFNVYRASSSSGPYSFLTKTTGTSYTDKGLLNGHQYCYYVESVSEYSAAPKIPHPLYDSSETVCGTPEDTIAPCSPILNIAAKCNLYEDSIIWNNPNNLCPEANKVVSYQIFYSPTKNGDMAPIATITNPEDTVYVNGNLTSVAGCYAVLAFDSAGQSSPFNTFCVDNCPNYELPNVFTPNGDGVNDLFTPLEPYRYVKDVDINIYNRWGQLLFHTTDPNINWNGKVNNTGGDCPDGVYYYICIVNEVRLEGIVPITLKGFIEIIRQK